MSRLLLAAFLVPSVSHAADPVFRDWSQPDGLLHAKYVYIAGPTVTVETEFGLRVKLKIKDLTKFDADYVELRRQLARRNPRVKIRIAETRRRRYLTNDAARVHWARERLNRRNGRPLQSALPSSRSSRSAKQCPF